MCTRCGACCRWGGYVRIDAAEADEIARALGMGVRAFADRYTRLTADRAGLSLSEKPDGSCVFFAEPDRCMVQHVKPRQCREFPNGWAFPGLASGCRAEVSA